MNAGALIGGFLMLLLQMLTEYIKSAPERKAQSNALVHRDLEVLSRGLDKHRMHPKSL